VTIRLIADSRLLSSVPHSEYDSAAESVLCAGGEVVNRVEHVTSIILRILELGAALVALLIVTLMLGILLQSIQRLIFGKATLVLPLKGSDKGPSVSSILAEQLGEIERKLYKISEDTKDEGREFSSARRLLATVNHAQPDSILTKGRVGFIADEPIDGRSIQKITLFGLTFSPELIVSLLYQARGLVAPRSIHGTLYEEDNTERLSVTLVYRRHERWTITYVRSSERSGQLFEIIDDVAFAVVKHRIGFESNEDGTRRSHKDARRRPRRASYAAHIDAAVRTEAKNWASYEACQQGYLKSLRFLRSGDIDERDDAIACFEQALDRDPDYYLAHYNIGALLYARYTAPDNESAIEHFRLAAKSSESHWRALALAALTMALSQQVHRFGYAKEPSTTQADDASSRALRIEPNLHEVCFARGWAYQSAEKTSDAISWYSKVVDIPLSKDPVRKTEQKRIKSFAETNKGWLLMTIYHDLTAAEECFRSALSHNKHNQMSYANLGDLYKRQGKFDLAIQEYEKAIDQEPHYLNAFNELGMVYIAKAAASRSIETQSAVDELLRAAYSWHEKALALTSEEDVRDRAQLRDKFTEALQESEFHLGTLEGPDTEEVDDGDHER
jgi:tetratricopeptide (TPR) repeat protein